MIQTKTIAPAFRDSYLVENPRFPFCKGCGHNNVIRRLNEALVALQLSPHDIALVTDIGCVGLADGLFKEVHTVHTTHGRSTGFATGIALADSILADRKLKTIVLIGDGGAIIGLQHLVHAAMLNVDVTVLICNNFVYGMTGGQGSGLTPECFVTATTPGGNIVPPVDLCGMLRHSNAPFVARTIATDKEFPRILVDAIAFPGFAAIEVLELCTEFAVPGNQLSGNKLVEIAGQNHWELGILHQDKSRKTYADRYRESMKGVHEASEERNGRARPEQGATLKKPVSVVIAGSAGERVQSAAGLLCQVALESGLHVTQKNDNPVTQGTGFSLSELWVSPDPIGFTGIDQPDVVLVTSDDGFRELKSQGWFGRLGKDSVVFLEESIDADLSLRHIKRIPFRKAFGAKSAALGALTALAEWMSIVETGRILATVETRYGKESALILNEGLRGLPTKDGTR